MTINSLVQQYLPSVEQHEARSIVRMVLEDAFGLSFTDICCGALDSMPEEDSRRLVSMLQRIGNGEPVQYVVGHTEFMGRTFHVAPGVLIPRPETEELCQWIIDDVCDQVAASHEATEGASHEASEGASLSLLDVGTGSGIIAVTLSKELASKGGGQQSSHPAVTAWDISQQALAIARHNAEALEADVRFVEQDALHCPVNDAERWDVIVSNPPYICQKEAVEMESGVLDHEPHLALFVPDSDPLLFYRSIAEYARHALKPQGKLYFEINPIYAEELKQMLGLLGFGNISFREDQFGKERMVSCH